MRTERNEINKRYLRLDPDDPENWRKWGQGLKRDVAFPEGCPGSGVLGPAELAGLMARKDGEEKGKQKDWSNWGDPGWGE